MSSLGNVYHKLVTQKVEQSLTLGLLSLFLKSHQQVCGQARELGAKSGHKRQGWTRSLCSKACSLQINRAGNIREREVKGFDIQLLRTQDIL